MKKLFTALMCCVFAVCSFNVVLDARVLTAKAASNEYAVLEYEYYANDDVYTVGGANTEVVYNGAFYAVSGTSSTGDVIVKIPATYDNGKNGNLPVLAISNNAFYMTDANVIGVDFTEANNLKYIGSFAFADSYSLKGEVVINNNTELIGRSAFKGAEITSVTFGGSVKVIEENAFALCNNLKGVIDLPASVQEIGESSFKNTKVSGLNVPSNSQLQTIGAMAFQDTLLSGNIFFPATVQKIGNLAFDTTTIKEVIFEATTDVATVGYGVFPSTVTAVYISDIDAYTAYLGDSAWQEYENILEYKEPTSYKINIEPNDNGKIYLSSTSVYEGKLLTVTVVPNKGYVLTKLTVNGEEVEFIKSGTSYVYKVSVWEEIFVSATYSLENETTSPSDQTPSGNQGSKGCKGGLTSTLPFLLAVGVATLVKKRK